MRALKYLRVCSWSVLLAVSACGPNSIDPDVTTPDGGQPDAADPNATWDGNVAETCTDYARSNCDYDATCVPFYLEWTYGSYAECLAQSKNNCLVQSEAPGTSWRPPTLLACARAAEVQACDDYSPLAACEVQPGAKANGANCVVSAQCASTYCWRDAANGCGVCADKAADGAACTRSANCQSGRCADKTCRPVSKEGEACAEILDCPLDFVCSAGTCQKPTRAPLGQPCDGDLGQCLGDLFCENAICSKAKFAGVGERCGFVEEGRSTTCRASNCSDAGFCVALAPLGAACSRSFECAGSALCTNGVCKAYTPDVCETTTPRASTSDTRELAVDPRLGGRAHRAQFVNIE